MVLVSFNIYLSWDNFVDNFILNIFNILSQRKRALKKHQAEAHSGGRAFECSICKKKLLHHRSLRDHKLTHANAKLHECTICGKGFPRSSSLRTHMIVHTADSPFVCDLCPARFKRSSVLKTHKLTHTGVRKFECDICKHRFHLKGALKHHILAHYGAWELSWIFSQLLWPGMRKLNAVFDDQRSRYSYVSLF